jgi:hypothetical protein
MQRSKTRIRRLVLGAMFGLLCAAVPASATPITFAYEGYINSLGGVMAEFFPGVEANSHFSGTFSFQSDETLGLVEHDLVFGDYEAAGFGGRRAFTNTDDPLFLSTTSQRMIDPGPVPVNVQWITIALDAGWQTGHLDFLAEGQRDFFKNAFWSGTITDVHQVPEPTTLALGLLALGAYALRSRPWQRSGALRENRAQIL